MFSQFNSSKLFAYGRKILNNRRIFTLSNLRVYSDRTRQRQIDGVSIVYNFWCDAAGLNAPID